VRVERSRPFGQFAEKIRVKSLQRVSQRDMRRKGNERPRRANLLGSVCLRAITASSIGSFSHHLLTKTQIKCP
jgi:hypothetical protein